MAKRIYASSKFFNFDTYKTVRQLEGNGGFTRGQSAAIMKTINAFLVDSNLETGRDLVTKDKLDNDTFKLRSNLDVVRDELSGLRQNDSLTLKGEADAILRNIENIEVSFQENLAQLKTDISMDLNTHKADTKELTSEVTLRIQEIHHQLVMRLSDVKTGVEAMKVELTTHIVWLTVGAVGSLIGMDWLAGLYRDRNDVKNVKSTQE